MRLSADQVELQDLVRRFFQDAVPSEYIRKRITSLLRRDEALVESVKQLGLEDGFGGEGATLSFAELALISEEVGRSLFPEPIGERLFGDHVLAKLLSEKRRAEYQALPVGTAFAPAGCCTLKGNTKSKKLSGEIAWAFGCEGAGRIVAVVGEGATSRVVAFSLGHPGVTVSPVNALDLTSALVKVVVKDVPYVQFDDNESEAIQDCYEILKASEIYGVTARVMDMTVEYLKTREQFGVPIGAFQALQQKLADAYAQSESLGALCRFAAWSVVHSAGQRRLTARAAICQAVEVGPAACEAAIQCHGGIGFTWEYDLHLFLRRVKCIQAGFPVSAARVDELLARAAS
jgi:alkylation response protein AidB-like acyl-CoA dehydrogenase